MSYRVSRKDLDRGEKIEAREHPEFSSRTQRRIAKDHLQRYGPGFYAAEPVTDKIIASKTKQMGARPVRHKSREEPYDPMRDGLPRDIRRPQTGNLFRF